MTKSVMKPRRKAKLPLAPPMEPRHKRTLIVVADGARARFFEPNHDTLTLVPARQADLVAPDSRRLTHDIVTDRPGRGFGSAHSSNRHAFEAPHDYHKLEKHNFTAALAQTLEDSRARREFDRLVLVAPRRSLGELHALLSPQVKKMVSHEIAKDLTTSTPVELWRALEKVLPTPVLA
ncbi:MAG TPA: host attachment protein [Reyranella sp.]|jgi:protein required for attachment to host cells|nr:host attachment protein [Reyranella sp.]